MGRKPNPNFKKLWTMVKNGMLLEDAWVACEEPTSWGNVLRLHKQMVAAGSSGSSSTELPTPRASRGEASSSTAN